MSIGIRFAGLCWLSPNVHLHLPRCHSEDASDLMNRLDDLEEEEAGMFPLGESSVLDNKKKCPLKGGGRGLLGRRWAWASESRKMTVT